MVSAKIVHIFSPCRIECQTERIKELLPDKILYASSLCVPNRVRERVRSNRARAE